MMQSSNAVVVLPAEGGFEVVSPGVVLGLTSGCVGVVGGVVGGDRDVVLVPVVEVPGCGVVLVCVPGFVVPVEPGVASAREFVFVFRFNMVLMAEELFVFEGFCRLVGKAGCVCSYEAWAAAQSEALTLSSEAAVQISVVPNTVMTAA